MILGLLDGLSSMIQFCDILAEHPISRSSRVDSLTPSVSDSITLKDLLDSSNSLSRLYTATSDDASEKFGGLDRSGSEAINPIDDNSNITCCCNSVKCAIFGIAAKSDKSMVTAEMDKQNSRGRGDRVANNVKGTNGRERSVVNRGRRWRNGGR
jgi:hypothetical protein